MRHPLALLQHTNHKIANIYNKKKHKKQEQNKCIHIDFSRRQVRA